MPEVVIVYHDDFLKHVTGRGHPESPERLRALMQRLASDGLLNRLVAVTPQPAPIETVLLAHAPHHVQWVEAKCREGAQSLDSGDTFVCPDSYQIALLAVGAAIAAADWVMGAENRRAFCAVRPPGHHAERDRALGFCLFNNVAICAKYFQTKRAMGKVLIVDWDVHHGNGTQNTFCADPSVLYFSTHQYPHYPGTGAEHERGEAKGEGYTINVPLPAGSGDNEFLTAFREKLTPAAEAFHPNMILISAGFDAHVNDPLAGMRVTTDGFGEMTRIVVELAERHSRGRIISVLEGGYDLKAMPASVAAHLRVLLE